jgi:hypothetical protein
MDGAVEMQDKPARVAWVTPELKAMSVQQTFTGSIPLPEEAIGAQTGNDLGLGGPGAS